MNRSEQADPIPADSHSEPVPAESPPIPGRTAGPARGRQRLLGALFVALVAAFAYTVYATNRGASEPGVTGPIKRVPTAGVVRLDGEPLAGAVVTFMPMDSGGTPTRGETDASGRYELFFQGFPGGTAPGKYKTYISVLTAPDGRNIGLEYQSGMTPHPIVFESTERLPPHYSNMGKSELITIVEEGKEVYDFNLKGPLLPGPSPDAAKTASDAPLPAPIPTP